MPMKQSNRQHFLNIVLALVAIAMLVAGAWLGMASVFAWIFKAWWSFAGVGVYSHGYIVLAMAIWMGWTYWQRNPPRSLAPSWWLLAPLLALVGLMSLLELLYVDSSRILLVPLLMLAAIGLTFGGQAGRQLAIPVFFLYFGLLPFWMLNPLLQALATRVVGFCIDLVSVPAYIEENFIHVTAGVFEIASACSGLSFFLSALALSVFYGAMYLRRWSYRLLVLVAATGAAVVSNWIRIWSLVMIGNYTNMHHYLVREHYLYGWALFVISMAPVLFFANWLTDRELAAKRAAAGGKPEEQQKNSSAASAADRPRSVPVMAITSILAAAIGALLLTVPRAFVAAEITTPNSATPLLLPDRFGIIEQVDATPDWHPVFSNAREGRASYQWGEATIHAYQAIYSQQGRGHHLFLGENSLVGGKRWQPVSQGRQLIRLDSEGLPAIEYRGRIAGRDYVVLGWYEVAGQLVNSRLNAKLAEVKAMPLGRNDGVATALAIECGLMDCDLPRNQLQEFVRISFPAIRPRL